MKVKRFIVFEFEQYYPGGGWEDFVGSFDTLKEAREAHPTGQIVDLETGDYA